MIEATPAEKLRDVFIHQVADLRSELQRVRELADRKLSEKADEERRSDANQN